MITGNEKRDRWDRGHPVDYRSGNASVDYLVGVEREAGGEEEEERG